MIRKEVATSDYICYRLLFLSRCLGVNERLFVLKYLVFRYYYNLPYNINSHDYQTF